MKLTNKLGLPTALVRAIQNDSYSSGGSWRTVTQLIAPPRVVALNIKHSHEIEEDVSEKFFRLFGQIVHTILERGGEKVEGLVETRLFISISGKLISGGLDSYTFKGGILTDWKFSTVYKAGNLPKEWEWQLNLLAALLRHHKYEVKEAQVYLLMRDHSKPKAKRESAYPQLPILKMPVPLWSQAEAFKYLEKRVELHLQAEKKLPECTADERWASPDVFAVMKLDRITAVRLLHTEVNAIEFIAQQDEPEKHFIQYRPGENKRCENYCSASQFCDQFKKLKEKK